MGATKIGREELLTQNEFAIITFIVLVQVKKLS